MGILFKLTNMAYNKPKNELIKNQLITKLALIMAIISQIMVPGITLAADSTTLANISQDSTINDLDIKHNADGRLLTTRYLAEETPDKVVKSVITAYTSTVDQCDDTPDYGAWGDHVYDGMIAANWLPRGTKIKIPALYGDKIFTVADRMNARYGYGRLDIWLDSTKTDARKFGVKRLDVEIYYPDAPAKQLAVAK